MSTTSKTIDRLKKGKPYREAFVTSQINVGIPFQIRALRKKQEMDQKALASAVGMEQSRISLLENPGYGSFTIETLKRLAAAFDVALIVRFAPFSELVRQTDNFFPDEFGEQTLSFEEEIKKITSLPANITQISAYGSIVAESTSAYAKSTKKYTSNASVGAPLQSNRELNLQIASSATAFFNVR